MKNFGIGVLVFTGIVVLMVLITGATVGFRWLGIEVDAWLGPKQMEVETTIHRNSKPFVDATIRELRKLQTEYLQTNSDALKSALAARILHAADELDDKWLNTQPDLRSFVMGLRAQSRRGAAGSNPWDGNK